MKQKRYLKNIYLNFFKSKIFLYNNLARFSDDILKLFFIVISGFFGNSGFKSSPHTLFVFFYKIFFLFLISFSISDLIYISTYYCKLFLLCLKSAFNRLAVVKITLIF